MTYSKTESFYNDDFKDFEEVLNTTFGIKDEISAKFLKRMLTNTVIKKSRIDIYNKKLILLSIFLFIPIILYLFSSLIFRIFKKNKSNKYDVVFEGWNIDEEGNFRSFEKYYKGLIDKLPDCNLAIFKPHNFEQKDNHIASRYNLDIIENDLFLNSNDAKKILARFMSNYIKIVKMSLKTNTNYIYLFSKFFYHYVMYTVRVQNISKAGYFISAGDNYFDALMYSIYKKNGINNILLIQNSVRSEDYLASFYITCDKYFSLDSQIKNGYLGLEAYEKIVPINSIGLYNAISNIEIKSPKFDIVFIETPFNNMNISNEKDPLHLQTKCYFDTLELLSEFSKEHTDVKIIYRVKKKEHPESYSTFVEKRDKILNVSNIKLDIDIHNNSYEAIVDSKVTLFVVTTMGIEAITIGKRVLCCNFEKFDFLISKKDEIGVLVDKDYSLFRNKLLKLLCMEDENINKYFEEKRSVYGDITESPYEKILETIKLG